MVSREGYADFSLRGIAKKVGVYLSTVQHHFPTKADLYQGMMNQTLDHYQPQIKALIGNEKLSIEDKIRKVSKFYLATTHDRTDLVIFRSFVNLALNDSQAANIVNTAYNESCNQFEALIQLHSPEIKKEESRNRAVAIMSLIEGFQSLATHETLSDYKRNKLERSLLDKILLIACN